MVLVIFLYLSFLAFIGFSVQKALAFAKMPMHGRWELYPVPKEKGKGHYGGSYYEEVKWWTRPRETSRWEELVDMGKEILFIKKLFQNQRPFWWLSYALHLGIYFIFCWFVLLFVHFFLPVQILSFLIVFTGSLGMVLVAVGSAGLLLKRMVHHEFKIYTTAQEYFNLAFLFVVAATGFLSWIQDGAFQYGQELMKSMLTWAPFSPDPMVAIHLTLFGLLMIYIPLTKMSHYVGKFFTFHQVLWDNEPFIPGNEIARKVKEAQTYAPEKSWSGPHYPGTASKTEERKEGGAIGG
ncbi:nitrate reductase gamma subunit [Candidatus Formimonas warabiya]|uniref:Nitrate reductase gamma subunit n=1 Tax=Formimonas warabiya TaxID=1761012 RepID=A0A3G1KYD1_FORW1|nr:nitrate reductase gamma subunit [Candidatus Formimonas warabiya]ATW27369.1 nitrate reductase gamma subunit [Candidatus Formimonas warabiya]